MDKEGFKIGDKVKLKGGSYGRYRGNDIGEVVNIDVYIEVLWGGNLKRKLGIYPHRASEIEHVVKVGGQLLFSFMNE